MNLNDDAVDLETWFFCLFLFFCLFESYIVLITEEVLHLHPHLLLWILFLEKTLRLKDYTMFLAYLLSQTDKALKLKFYFFKRQPHKMVKHTQAINR